MSKMTKTQQVAAALSIAALMSPLPLMPRFYGRPPGRPGVKKLRAKRKVRNRMVKNSRRRNRAG